MPETQTETIQKNPTSTEQSFRPLYLRRVPEQIWILVHDNAIRSRMRLQDYLVKIMETSQPISKPVQIGPIEANH